MEEQFAGRATRIPIEAGAGLPAEAASWTTPVTATSAAIEYRGLSPGTAFAVVDPSDPASLADFWNARACGARVFPIPVGHVTRVLAAAESWLQHALDEGDLSRWIRGDDTPAGPRIYIWQSTDQVEPPGLLTELLARHDVAPWLVTPDEAVEFARGWSGDHPFTTRFTYSFSQPLEADGQVARIPVPGIPAGAPEDGAPMVMSSQSRCISHRPGASGLTGRSPFPTSGPMPRCCASMTVSC